MALNWAKRLAGRFGPRATTQPVVDAADAYADALLALGFDHARYRQDYDVLADLSPHALARHYHGSGRVERLGVQFDLPLPEALARIAALDAPADVKDLLRVDVAASASRISDVWGRDDERTSELLAASAVHRPLIVISDSHGMLYLSEDILRVGGLLPVPFLCTGASARGLGNPASRAGAGERIRQFLRTHEGQLANAVVLLKFGQVDLEFVYDYRRIRDGQRAFDWDHAIAFAQDSARRYAAFVRDLRAETAARLVVTSTLPPALSDVALRDGYMNAHIVELHADLDPEALRRELQTLEMPSWAIRTELARAYNAALATECEAAGLTFYDDFTGLVGPEGVIDPDVIIWHGGTDHHLCATSPAARRAASGFAADLAKL